MSQFYDQASLVMIPSGYKAGKVYSQKPLSADGELTFSRASTATRVNASGLIEKVRENLLLQSNTFSTTWTNNNSTETGGQAGYDGTNNAWLLQATATSAARLTQTQTTNGLQTFSLYAKAGTSNFLILEKPNVGTYLAWFDLSNGTLGTVTGGTATITSVGNGWYRCTINGTPTASADVRIFVADGNGSSAVTIGGNILIQSAQLETGDIATDYIATTSSAVSVGPVSGLPRLDYSGGATCPSLLLEPQRTNLALYSEQFDNAGWAKSGASVTANAVLGPDGYTSADKLVEDTSTGVHIATQSNLFTATGAWYTASIFVKAAERTYAAFSTRGNFTSNDNTLIFNLTTGEWELDDSGQNYALNAEAFPNGWYRISLNTNTTSGAYDGFGIGIATGSTFWGDAVYTGDGTSGIYIFGAQMEAGQYESSLIQTLSTAVTRVADACSKTGISSLIGQTEGTFYAELEVIGGITSAAFYARNPSGGSYGEFMALYFNADKYPTFEVRTGNTEQAFLRESTAYSSGFHKIAGAYKANDFVLYVDGVQLKSDTSGSIPALSELYLGAYVDGGSRNHTKKQALVFKTRLTDAQLAELTTL